MTYRAFYEDDEDPFIFEAKDDAEARKIAKSAAPIDYGTGLGDIAFTHERVMQVDSIERVIDEEGEEYQSIY